MAVTLITNEGIVMKSLEDFRTYADANREYVFRQNNRQVSPDDVKDGDRVNVVIKASGN